MKTIEKIYENRYSDIDLNKEIFAASIVNYFQDLFVRVSIAKGTGRGIEYMNSKNLTWIIYRWHLKMIKYPDCKEDVIVKMTPAAYKKSYMNINFSMYDKNGDKVAEAFSLWILLDIKENRPYTGQDEDENIRQIFGLDKIENKINTMRKVDIIRKIETAEEMENEKRFKVGYSDVDTNNHANNIRYISWMTEPISRYLMNGYEIDEMKISYRKAAMYGEMVKISSHVQDDGEHVKSLNKITGEDNSILAASEIFMKRK